MLICGSYTLVAHTLATHSAMASSRLRLGQRLNARCAARKALA